MSQTLERSSNADENAAGEADEAATVPKSVAVLPLPLYASSAISAATASLLMPFT
jgi:hypothetical protein